LAVNMPGAPKAAPVASDFVIKLRLFITLVGLKIKLSAPIPFHKCVTTMQSRQHRS